MLFVDKSGRKRNGILARCVHCKSRFPTRTDQPAKFCSRECVARSRMRRTLVRCAWCSSSFHRKKSQQKKSKSGLFFCSRKCKERAQSLDGLQELWLPHFGSRSSYRSQFDLNSLKCSRCGYSEFSCGIDIHHIDKDRGNNEKENLVPLCASCHRALHMDCWQLSD